MSKVITIKLTKANPNSGPYNIYDDLGNTIAIDVPRKNLILGSNYIVDDNVQVMILESTGKCKFKKSFLLSTFNLLEFNNATYVRAVTGCLWRHLTSPTLYNYFYGQIEPYIIEYPFSFQYQDEILQNVKDYTKAYEYLPIPDGVFNANARIETNGKWFNKAIVYNGQQSSGILNLVPKPLNNMQEYMKYPIYNTDSKTITFTKSDNFYQYNTFWSLVKDVRQPLFNVSCESLSIDKVVNQNNMDYGKRSFKKSPLRAKELKVRHILDDKKDIHLVSQFIVTPSQISYK